MIDIFNNDAFSVVSLTDAINEIKYRPSRLQQLGLFKSTAVTTTTVLVERKGDIIQLVPPTPRGGPGSILGTTRANGIPLSVPHFQVDWSVVADEVQNVRAWGSETQLATVQGIVAQKLADNIAALELTTEHAQLGAIKGIITYADNTTTNLFTTFDVTPPTEIDFDLDNVSPAPGALRKKCAAVIRAMRKAVGGTNFTHVHAMVGDTFFDQLLSHPEVIGTYLGWGEARILRESYIGLNRAENPTFEFGGIIWENYGAIDDSGDGSLVGIAPTEARFFPVGLQGLFRTYYAPADYNDTVNTLGKKFYAKQWTMPNDKGVQGETQTNALHICTRPGALQRGKNT